MRLRLFGPKYFDRSALTVTKSWANVQKLSSEKASASPYPSAVKLLAVMWGIPALSRVMVTLFAEVVLAGVGELDDAEHPAITTATTVMARSPRPNRVVVMERGYPSDHQG